MIRTILELLASRSIDGQQPPTPWLQRRLQRNQQLHHFDSETRQLDALLRRSADEHRQAMQAATNQSTLTLPPHRNTAQTSSYRQSLRWLAGLAAAAVLLLAMTPNLLRNSTPAVHAGEFSEQFTTVPGEVLRLISHAAETSQTRVTELSPLTNLFLPSFPDWRRVTKQLEIPIQQEINSWQNLRLRLPELPSTEQELQQSS